VSGVPQRGQKVRSAWSDDEKHAGSPEISVNALVGTENHATNGAPLVRLQIEQWQFVS
jgi:hypothetical protein